MKVAMVFTLLVAYVAAKPTLESCKCWDAYEAKQDDAGSVSCHGKMVFAIKPCNLPEPPKCVCSKDAVSSILTDQEGTWCSQSEKGVFIKKWKCENEKAWAEYKVKSDEYAAQIKADGN